MQYTRLPTGNVLTLTCVSCTKACAVAGLSGHGGAGQCTRGRLLVRADVLLLEPRAVAVKTLIAVPKRNGQRSQRTHGISGSDWR